MQYDILNSHIKIGRYHPSLQKEKPTEIKLHAQGHNKHYQWLRHLSRTVILTFQKLQNLYKDEYISGNNVILVAMDMTKVMF